jgi:hypothetical protein
MKVGDIVLYQETRWKVVGHSTSFRTVQLVAFDGRKNEIPDDLDQSPELRVLYHPPTQWPFAVCSATRGGPLRSMARGNVGLSPMEDWVPSDFLRANGAVFFNPSLRLRHGEVLVGVHQDGTRSRIAVTKSFGTVQRRTKLARDPAKVRGPLSSIDRLLNSSLLDEDED